MNEPKKSTNPLHTIFTKAPGSLRFGFIIALLLVILSLGNVILYSFLGMQINSKVFLAASLITFIIVFFASLQTAYGKTTVNWVMFIITILCVVIVAAKTSMFKSIPQVELDNLCNTLIALTFGCTVIFAFCSGYNHVEMSTEKEVVIEEEEVTEETSEENIEEATEETVVDTEDITNDNETADEVQPVDGNTEKDE